MTLKDVIDEMEHWNGVEPQPMVAVNRWISSLRQARIIRCGGGAMKIRKCATTAKADKQ